MATYYTPVQDGTSNPKAHFGQEIFNPVLAQLETLAYYQSGWYRLAGWTTMGGTSPIITLSGISTAWRHLKVVALLRSTQAAITEDLLLDFNSGSGSDYYWNNVSFNNATNFTSGTANGSINCGDIVAASAPADHFSPVMIDIHDYQKTDVRTVLVRNYAHASNLDAGMLAVEGVGEWRGPSGGINAINLLSGGSQFDIGSMYALYGQDRYA